MVVKVWVFNKKKFTRVLSNDEEIFYSEVSEVKAKRFLLSRSCIRIAMSNLFKKNPKNVNIEFIPNKPPNLKNELGFLSISYCKDAFLEGWSDEKLGIDIENKDRELISIFSLRRFFQEEEILKIISEKNKYHNDFLKSWVKKEALIKYSGLNLWRDSKDFIWDQKQNLGINRNRDLKVKVRQIRFMKWELGIASNHLSNSFPIICYE